MTSSYNLSRRPCRGPINWGAYVKKEGFCPTNYATVPIITQKNRVCRKCPNKDECICDKESCYDSGYKICVPINEDCNKNCCDTPQRICECKHNKGLYRDNPDPNPFAYQRNNIEELECLGYICEPRYYNGTGLIPHRF